MIDIMVNEHKHIKVVLKSIEIISKEIMNGAEVEDELYRRMIDFVRNYADKYHHKKEEDYVFNRMSLDKMAEGPVQGMLLEHDMGRKYIMNLEKALNECKQGNKDEKVRIVTYGMAYRDLLEDHISKEDNVIYKFALRVIDEEEVNRITGEFDKIEEAEENRAIREKYEGLAQELRSRFNIE